jgi:hypothetical protein
MTHLGDVGLRHVCTRKAHMRARRGYERDAAMAAFAKAVGGKAWTGRLTPPFRTLKGGPKDLRALPGHVEPAVS